MTTYSELALISCSGSDMVRSRHANMSIKAVVMIRIRDANKLRIVAAVMLKFGAAVMLTIYAFLLIMGTIYRRTS